MLRAGLRGLGNSELRAYELLVGFWDPDGAGPRGYCRGLHHWNRLLGGLYTKIIIRLMDTILHYPL